MMTVALVLIALPLLLFGWAYAGYPLVLWLLSRGRAGGIRETDPAEWPLVTITVPAFNEEARIERTIESLLAVDYPADRRQILIVSDASTDGTDAAVRRYEDRGVELVRAPVRGGKTAAENLASASARGEIVVNTDASIQVLPHSVKALVRALGDPAVGVASGRDLSVGGDSAESNRGEGGYVGYEMWVRGLETRLGSIVGASGCLYAARTEIQREQLPPDLARDFASALLARRRGLRAVSVPDATCLVPRTASLDAELRRKVRTMAQGLETLGYFRALLDPVRERGFALMLASHKLCRWLVYLTLPLALAGLALASARSVAALWVSVLVVAGIVAGAAALRWPAGRRVPSLLAIAGFVLASNTAGVLAWVKVMRRQRMPTWEPTRRPL